MPDDNRNDDPGADSGPDFHGARLGYYGADGDSFVWRDDNRDTDYARCTGSVFLD